MELDAFQSRLGPGQGRLPRGDAGFASGEHIFVLGEEEAGRFFELQPGDYAEVLQDTDLTDVEILRADLQLRVPKSLDPGLAWEVSLVVAGAKRARALGFPHRTRTLTGLAANVSKLNGVHPVGVRLELVEV